MTEDQYPAAAQTSASGPATAAAIKAGRPGERPRPKRVRDENGNLVQPTPYYVQASCELSEDHFLTDDVIIEDGDKIMPFSVVDTFTGTVTVEALVLSSRTAESPVPGRGRHLGLVVHAGEDAL